MKDNDEQQAPLPESKSGVLTTSAHPRDSAGKRYVYPVISRRAGGVSIGINLNPNAACNWRCVYCQVPGLTRGSGPSIDLDLLEEELRALLQEILHGDFLQRRVPETSRTLKDIAFSGDGEPTTSPDLGAAIGKVCGVLEALEVLNTLELVLITNGSQLGKDSVRAALGSLAAAGGNVWFKLDGGSELALRSINSVALDPERHLERLRRCASICPTFIQTCMFARHGKPPDETSVRDYLGCLSSVAGHPGVQGVLLYSLARPSMQPESSTLSRLPPAWLEALGRRIQTLGLSVRISP